MIERHFLLLLGQHLSFANAWLIFTLLSFIKIFPGLSA